MTENTWSSSQIAEREDSKDGNLSNLCSALESQNIESDSMLNFSQVDKVIDNSERDQSPPSDIKSAYSSVVGVVSCFHYRLIFTLLNYYDFLSINNFCCSALQVVSHLNFTTGTLRNSLADSVTKYFNRSYHSLVVKLLLFHSDLLLSGVADFLEYFTDIPVVVQHAC